LRALLTGIAVAASLTAAAAEEVPGVVIAEATVLDFPLEVEALGTARANESVDVRPEITETITSIQFVEGQHAEAGAVLVTLEDSEAVAAVAAARAALVESENQLRRAQELFKTRALSASELDQRSARRDADRAILDAAESRLADTRVCAPFAGRVGLRRVSVGSLVTPDTVITTLDDMRTIKLDFDVPETALSRLAEGLPVAAHSAAWPHIDFRGEISTVDTRVDPVTRTVTVRALVPNEDGRLRPGMFLSVTVYREDVTALVVPEQAIVPEASRQFVMVVGPDGVVERRAVRTGRRRAGQVEILEGLAEGERVIAEGTQKAQPGHVVEVVGRVALRDAAVDTTP
jgi:membrane fusion protein (multidrug efflux system)